MGRIRHELGAGRREAELRPAERIETVELVPEHDEMSARGIPISG